MQKREKFCKTLWVLFCGKAVLFIFGRKEGGGGVRHESYAEMHLVVHFKLIFEKGKFLRHLGTSG